MRAHPAGKLGEGATPSDTRCRRWRRYFNPCPPRGGRPGPHVWNSSTFSFQSTPPARGATTAYRRCLQNRHISIHAPREGGDDKRIMAALGIKNFNPRPPRGGRRLLIHRPRSLKEFQSTPPARGATNRTRSEMHLTIFQSTPPARGATQHSGQRQAAVRYFNPRPPRGGRPYHIRIRYNITKISIHAPARGATVRR